MPLANYYVCTPKLFASARLILARKKADQVNCHFLFSPSHRSVFFCLTTHGQNPKP